MSSSYPSYITVKAAGSTGSGCFTSKEIPSGQLIFDIERPFIVTLDSARLIDTCERCLINAQGNDESGSSLKACTGCNVVRYCSKVCLSTRYFLFLDLIKGVLFVEENFLDIGASSLNSDLSSL